MKRTRIFITGMGGMIGRNLALLALRNNYVVGGTINNNLPSELAQVRELKKYRVNLLKISKIGEAVLDFQPDLVVHLAGRVLGRSDKRVSEGRIYLENIEMLKNVIEAIRSLAVKPKFIFVSGCLVYDKSKYKTPLKEILPEGLPNVDSIRFPYRASRIDQEKLLVKESWLNYIIVRPTQISGQGKISGVVEYYIAQEIQKALGDKNKKEFLIGNKLAEVDFIDVRDASKALLLLANSGKKRDIYHLCSGKPITVEKLIRVFLATCGLRWKDYSINSMLEESVYFRFSSKKLKDLGWKQDYSLTDTLTSYFEYFKNLKS